MARTVDRPIVLPLPQIRPLAEVADVYQGGGLQRIGRALNSLYDQHRGSLVADFTRAKILTGVGAIAYYRVDAQGGGGLLAEAIRADLCLTLEGGGGGATCVIDVRVTADGATTHTYRYNYSTDKTEAWVEAAAVGTDAIADDVTEVDVELEITTVAVMNKTWVYGLGVQYERAQTALDAGVYDNGAVPIEASVLDGERPVSVDRVQAMHTLARLLYLRTGSALACARSESPFILYTATTPETVYAYFDVACPSSKSATLTLRVRVRYVTTSGGATPSGTIRAELETGQSASAAWSGADAEGWLNLDIASVPAPDDAGVEPSWLGLTVSASLAAGIGTITVKSVCANWRGVSL